MGKFARYFILIFILTLIIPLMALFIYSHHQMKKVEKYSKTHMLETAKMEIQAAMQNYLKNESAKIIKSIYYKQKNLLTQDDINELFKNEYKIGYIKTKGIKQEADFELLRIDNAPGLYAKYVIPVKGDKFRAINLLKPVKFSDIEINGPFQLELYSGDIISPENLVGVLVDKKLQLKQSSIKEPYNSMWHIKTGVPKDRDVSYEVVKINKKNYVEATILVKTIWPRPLGKPLEGKIGILIIVAGMLTSIASTLYVSRNFVSPYLMLSYASKKVRSGDLDFTIDTHTTQKEVQKTYDNFNKMVKGLKEKEELRSSFIRNLTHDLRTPLIAQERALSFISDKFKSLDLNEEMELAKSLEKNAAHLLRMVNLILESYQFNLKAEDLKFTYVNLKELINESYLKIKPLADEKNIIFINNISDVFGMIKADITCLDRIFINLISNAIENLSNEGIITIDAKREPGFVYITVRDNGSGISKEDIEHVFDRYYSGKSYNRKLGAGLGLDVCKKLISAHNGKILIRSELGKYTEFEICLPENGRNV